jgi:hypothetical protein
VQKEDTSAIGDIADLRRMAANSPMRSTVDFGARAIEVSNAAAGLNRSTRTSIDVKRASSFFSLLSRLFGFQ